MAHGRISRLPTTDGRELLLRRYTQPEAEHRMLLQRLHSTLPGQPQPKTGQAPSVPGPAFFGAADRLGETGIEMTHAGALVLLAHPPTQVST